MCFELLSLFPPRIEASRPPRPEDEGGGGPAAGGGGGPAAAGGGGGGADAGGGGGAEAGDGAGDGAAAAGAEYVAVLVLLGVLLVDPRRLAFRVRRETFMLRTRRGLRAFFSSFFLCSGQW